MKWWLVVFDNTYTSKQSVKQVLNGAKMQVYVYDMVVLSLSVAVGHK